MGHRDDVYDLILKEIDEGKRKGRKDIATGSSNVLWPAKWCLRHNVHGMIELSQECCFGGLVPVAIPPPGFFNFFVGGVEEMKLAQRSFR